MLYINGKKATKKDIEQLTQDLKTGRAIITSVKKTRAGAFSLTVEA